MTDNMMHEKLANRIRWTLADIRAQVRSLSTPEGAAMVDEALLGATLEALKREDANVVIVVISADIQPLARQRVVDLGAAAFVAKPVTAEALLNALHFIGVL